MRDLTIIGERINPGFKSSKALFDHLDIEGIQALAIKQADAGAHYINVNIGMLALENPEFMKEVIVKLQDVVDIPLSIDFPNLEVQEMCLKIYDPAKANGAKPIINSLAEPRWDMAEALKIQPSRIVVMASERLEDGRGKPNKTPQEIYSTAKRLAVRLVKEYGITMNDIIVDVSILTLAADREGLVRAALDAVKLIGEDPELQGIHMMGGISNIGMMLPPKAADGGVLKRRVERAFVTMAQPHGFDTVLATPWDTYEHLPEDDFVLTTFKELLERSGIDAVTHMRKLYLPA